MKCGNKLCKYNDDYYRDNCRNTEHAELARQCMKNNFNHYEPADLAQPGASAKRISSVVRSNATLKQKYLSLCNEFGFKPASIGSGDDVKDIIQQSWSMADEFVRKLTELLKS